MNEDYQKEIDKLSESPDPLTTMDYILYGSNVRYVRIDGDLWDKLHTKAQEDFHQNRNDGLAGASGRYLEHFHKKLAEWAGLSKKEKKASEEKEEVTDDTDLPEGVNYYGGCYAKSTPELYISLLIIEENVIPDELRMIANHIEMKKENEDKHEN